jgi:hypothetical protein
VDLSLFSSASFSGISRRMPTLARAYAYKVWHSSHPSGKTQCSAEGCQGILRESLVFLRRMPN